MNLTTKDIIQLLPFGAEFKQELLNDFDTLTEDQRFEIEQMIWDAYDELYQIRLEANTEEAFKRVEKKEEMFDEDFYKRVKEKTDREMMQQDNQAPVPQDVTKNLDATRQELEKILQQA